MRPLLALCLGLLAAPLASQELPEPGAIPAFRAQMRGVLSQDPMDSWRSYLRDGLPGAVVEVVSTFTEEELHEMAFVESIQLLRQRLRELWVDYGSAMSREHTVAALGDSPARVYPLGRVIKP